MATKLKQASISIRTNKNKDLSPNWDGAEDWDSEQFNRHYRNAMAWYRLEKSGKELKPSVIDWMSRANYPKKVIKAFKDTKDSRCTLTMGSIAACLLKGMPSCHPNFNNGKDTATWLGNEIAKVIENGKNDETNELPAPEKAIQAPVQTIQERVREAAGEMCEELDVAIDKFLVDPNNFDPKEFKIISLLRGKGVKSAHSRYIKGFYQRAYDELLELASGNGDEQLREGYKHLAKKNVRKLIEFYASIMAACEQITAEQKVIKKPRAKKVKPAEELVKKLKFCIKDDKLKIVSVPPAQLVGAQGAVFYNVKTRKIAYVISKSSAGLNVKNSSIIDFSEKSFQKTLRKPDEQLKEFKEQNTQRRFETWFNKHIKTTETMFTGRTSEDMIILKVFK